MKSAEESGLSKRAFAVSWTLRDDGALKKAGIAAADLAREADGLLGKFPSRSFGACLSETLDVLSERTSSTSDPF